MEVGRVKEERRSYQVYSSQSCICGMHIRLLERPYDICVNIMLNTVSDPIREAQHGGRGRYLRVVVVPGWEAEVVTGSKTLM